MSITKNDVGTPDKLLWEGMCFSNRKANVRKERLSEIVGFENMNNVLIVVHDSTS